MKRNRIFLVLLFIFLVYDPILSFADFADIEVAVIEQDFARVQKLATDVINSPADKKTKNDAKYYLGLSYLRLNDYIKAEEIFSKLVKLHLKNGEKERAYIGLFDAYYMQGDYKDALKTIKKLIKTTPHAESMSLIYLKAARANLKLANWAKARDYLQKIVTQFPKSLEKHTAKQLMEEKQYFAVQVGAFLDRKHAEELTKELKQRQEYAYIVETLDSKNRKFYRVRVGRLSVLNEAERLKAKLATAGYPARIYP